MIAVGEHGMLPVSGWLGRGNGWTRRDEGGGVNDTDGTDGTDGTDDTGGVAARLREVMLDGGELGAVLSAEVCFGSPALPEPTTGRERVAHVLATARSVYEGLAFTETVGGGDRAVLFFSARVGGEPLQGAYSLHGDGSGRIARIDALFRPVGPTQALVAEMMRRLTGSGAGA
jgi:hypothetical protein